MFALSAIALGDGCQVNFLKVDPSLERMADSGAAGLGEFFCPLIFLSPTGGA